MSLRHSIFLAVVAFMTSCGSPRDLSEFVKVDHEGWFAPVDFKVEVGDTIKRVDMQFILRYRNSIPTDSVELMVTTTAPDGVKWSERFTMPTPTGVEQMVISERIYRKDIRWSQMGEYRVSLLPQAIYEGITDVGIKMIGESREEQKKK